MTRNITENPLINNVLYKQVAQKEDVVENTTQQEKAAGLSQMQKRYDIIEYQDNEDSAGIYELKKDESGRQQIRFNHPEDKDSNAFDNIEDVDKSEEDNKNSERNGEKPIVVVTTLDLSAVEREIKQLKQQQQQLEQKLNSAAEEQKKDIQVELDRVIQELKRKDTDTYRDSHACRRQYTLD